MLSGIADKFGERQSLVGMYTGIAAMFGWWLLVTNIWGLAVFALIFGICYGGYRFGPDNSYLNSLMPLIGKRLKAIRAGALKISILMMTFLAGCSNKREASIIRTMLLGI